MLANGAEVAITGRRLDVLRTAAEQLRQGGRLEYVAADVSTEKGRGDDAYLRAREARRSGCTCQQCWRS
ncbi:hypothetical protein [Bradyrhizobium elkanii]|uniref:hypothetical protein n=1 Tax=Bradyrhizobium elkanii TaxID=29448 RepID=UPI0024BFBB09|nr:hypothetical protein [Bradyrhizobium elkanii]